MNDSLIIENPTKLTGTSFKITINGNDFEYEVSEEKDVNKVIDKLNTWIARGPESFGGLYDYIKRSFQLVGQYQEPVMEAPEEELEPEIEIPSDEKDIDEIEDDQLELTINIENDKIKINLEDWTGTFSTSDETKFIDTINSLVKEEMTLRDRTELVVQIVKMLEADDLTDFYNLINLLFNTGVDIIDTFKEVEDDELMEPESLIEPSESPIDLELTDGVKVIGNQLVEDDDFDLYDDQSEDKMITLDELINDETFLLDLANMDLSLFKITKNEKVNEQTIYFIGGVNERGNKFSLSYTNEKPIELTGLFDELKDLDVCLNNIEDLSTVTGYINKLNEIVYNKEMKGADNE